MWGFLVWYKSWIVLYKIIVYLFIYCLMLIISDIFIVLRDRRSTLNTIWCIYWFSFVQSVDCSTLYNSICHSNDDQCSGKIIFFFLKCVCTVFVFKTYWKYSLYILLSNDLFFCYSIFFLVINNHSIAIKKSFRWWGSFYSKKSLISLIVEIILDGDRRL